jgi:O-antigen/teichoic acid export membrane protein
MSIDKVLKNSVVYGTISVLQKAISFLLLPLYTAYLTTSDIGIIAVVTSIFNILSIVFGLALNSAANRFYYEYKEDAGKVKVLFGTIFSFVLLNSLVLSAILLIFNKFLLSPFSKGIPFYPYLFLGIVITFFSTGYTMYQYILQAKQLGKQYGLNNILFFVVNVVSTIILLVVFKLKASSVLISMAGTNVIFFIYTIYKFVPQIKIGLDLKTLAVSLKYSFPLIPHSLASWFMVMVNTIILNNIMGTSAVGVYSVGFQLGNILNIITGAINQAFVPWFFESFKEGKKDRIIRFAEIMILLYSLLALSISFFSKEILGIMVTSDFREAWKIVAPLSFAFVFSGLYYFASAALFYNTKTIKLIPIITIISALINVPLNLLLIPRMNEMGAALSCLISLAFSAVIAQILSMRYEPINYNWKRMYTIIILACLLSCIGYLEINEVTLFLTKVAIIIIISLYVFNRYKQDIIQAMSLFRVKFIR